MMRQSTLRRLMVTLLLAGAIGVSVGGGGDRHHHRGRW